jgi:hypothetical protein
MSQPLRSLRMVMETQDLREVPVEPSEPSKGTREPAFKFLLGVGTAILFFGALFSQIPGRDRAPDLVIFLTAAAFLLAALLVGQLPRRASKAEAEWRSEPVSTVILLLELAASLIALSGLVIYELHRH